MTNKNNTLKETMKIIEEVINENPNPIKDLNNIYHFEITDIDNATYRLELHNGTATIEEVFQHTKEDIECKLIMSEKSFKKFLAGKLNGTVAFMSGKLKIKGDMTKALKLESLLKKYTFPEL